MEPSETRFDLRFWLFGTHVRVSPWFWLMGAVLGWGLAMGGDTRTGLLYLAVWVVCVFVSVLLHEFGHVWMGRWFGSHGHIVLHSFGGLAVGSNALNRGWQRFVVAFAGPLIQLVLFAILVVIGMALGLVSPQTENWVYPPAWVARSDLLGRTLGFLLEINLFWPILNLLPIWPLDGGQMSREVFVAANPRNGVVLALGLSAALAGLMALHCLMMEVNPAVWPLRHYLPFGGLFMAIFFALFCYQSVLALTTIRTAQTRRYSDDEFPWER